MEHSPGFLALVNTAKSRVKETDLEGYRNMLAEGTPHALVDVREDHEFSAGHVKGARHIGRGILERDIEAALPDFAFEIVLYCGGGFRSALAADSLQQMGYTHVTSMAGGWRDWNAAKGAVE